MCPVKYGKVFFHSCQHALPPHNNHGGCCMFSPWQPRWTAPMGERAWSRSHPSLRASQWARRHWAALFPPTGHFCGFYRWAGPLVSAHTTTWSSFWEFHGSVSNIDDYLEFMGWTSQRNRKKKIMRYFWSPILHYFITYLAKYTVSLLALKTQLRLWSIFFIKVSPTVCEITLF